MRYLIAFFIVLILTSCEKSSQQEALPIFELVPVEKSQVDFVNRLRESPSQNVLTYEYYYNGAGLAVGDLNGDQAPDLLFVSNLEDNVLYLNEGKLQFDKVPSVHAWKGRKGFYTGVSLVDINHDGKLDVYMCKSGRFDQAALRRNELYINQGNNAQGVPTFKESAKQYGLDLATYSTQAAFFDYDKDGDLDLFLINHGIDTYALEEISDLKSAQDGLSGAMLFENQHGYFREVTTQAHIENNRLGFGLGIAIGDLNNDNWPDVYISNDYSGKDHLYINKQDKTFEERVQQLTGHTSFYSMGNDMGDINNDGWVDIVNLDMVSPDNYGVKTSMSAMNPAQFDQLVQEGQHRQYMYNSLLVNNGTGHQGRLHPFSDIAQMAGMASTDWSWAPLLFDFDNDGLRDIFISNGIKRNIRNNDAIKAVQKYRRLMRQSNNSSQKAMLIKQMLDAFPYHRKANFFFRNTGDWSFESLGPALGLDSLKTASNGAVYADLDMDGDLELIVNNVDQPAMIFKNNSRENGTGYYLQIEARGATKNPFGIGLKVEAWHGGTPKIAELYLSRGYLSSVDPVLHLGLGEIKQLDSLKAIWPDDKVQVLRDVQVNQRLILDHQDAEHIPSTVLQKPPQHKFRPIHQWEGPNFLHRENEFDDFERESLLPHKMSQMGPAMAVGDVNGDGLDDFFMGNGAGYAAKIFLQDSAGNFVTGNEPLWQTEAKYEDVAAHFFDAEGDGDLDLILGNGGNEFQAHGQMYQLRLYKNDGKGNFKKVNDWGVRVSESVSCIRTSDIDGDGDKDIFVGGRQIPGSYPLPASSYILLNQSQGSNIRFADKTQEWAGFLKDYGMVTDATLADLNGDDKADLILVGEWMAPAVFYHETNRFSASKNTLDQEKGWWFCIEAVDIDKDGDLDLIGGNLGLNYKYKANATAPFEIFARDFDSNGSMDIVLGYQENSLRFPLRGRECSSNQMPFIKKKFPTYDAFGKATLEEVYGANGLDSARSFLATNFGHTYFENLGNGEFRVKTLPLESQISSVNDILVLQHNNEVSLLLAGNMYGSEVETPRNDASIGSMIHLGKNGKFEAIPAHKSGLQLIGEVKHLLPIQVHNQPAILVGKNQGFPEIITPYYKSSL